MIYLEEILERADELYDLIAKEKDNVLATGNISLHGEFKEAQISLSRLVEKIENLLKN